MTKRISSEKFYRIYDDDVGDYIQVGPDADALDLVEIRLVEGSKISGSITTHKEQAVALARAILDLYGAEAKDPVRVRKPQPPTEAYTVTQIEERIDKICGCAGQWRCDCVSVFSRASVELWTEHNARKSNRRIDSARKKFRDTKKSTSLSPFPIFVDSTKLLGETLREKYSDMIRNHIGRGASIICGTCVFTALKLASISDPVVEPQEVYDKNNDIYAVVDDTMDPWMFTPVIKGEVLKK